LCPRKLVCGSILREGNGLRTHWDSGEALSVPTIRERDAASEASAPTDALKAEHLITFCKTGAL
jgi:hypothetical protein